MKRTKLNSQKKEIEDIKKKYKTSLEDYELVEVKE